MLGLLSTDPFASLRMHRLQVALAESPLFDRCKGRRRDTSPAESYTTESIRLKLLLRKVQVYSTGSQLCSPRLFLCNMWLNWRIRFVTAQPIRSSSEPRIHRHSIALRSLAPVGRGTFLVFDRDQHHVGGLQGSS